MAKIAKLSKQEEKTKSFRSFNKKKAIVRDSYNKHMDVKTYLEKFKNNIKIVMSRKKTIKKFFRKMNNIRKEYLKTVTKKQFEKEKKGFLKELTTNTRYVELAKCSFDKCLKLHKKGLVLVKNLTDKLCKKRKYSKGL